MTAQTPHSSSDLSVIIATLALTNEKLEKTSVMKRQMNSRPTVGLREHEAMHNKTAVANRMKSVLSVKTRIYLSSHLDVPRTASSQCLLDDGDIAATVMHAIDCITSVPDGAIQVGVKNGWVMLRGDLDNWTQRESVERIALHSVGVRGVVNSITINEKPISAL